MARSPSPVAASWLLSAWDQNIALGVMWPTGTRLDAIALDWVVAALGLPKGTGGGFVTGAVHGQRHLSRGCSRCGASNRRLGCAPDGPRRGAAVQVVVGEEAHAMVHKVLGIVGLGRDRALRLPTDDQGRIRPVGLPRLDGPTIVCLQAGNVNSGASDPFPELIDWAREFDAWVHVDGAFGALGGRLP